MTPCLEASEIIVKLQDRANTPDTTRALIAARVWHWHNCPECNRIAVDGLSLAEQLFGAVVR